LLPREFRYQIASRFSHTHGGLANLLNAVNHCPPIHQIRIETRSITTLAEIHCLLCGREHMAEAHLVCLVNIRWHRVALRCSLPGRGSIPTDLPPSADQHRGPATPSTPSSFRRHQTG